jgi:hypothetical protein
MTLVPCIVPRGGDCCDFCCTSPVSTVYVCSNFEVEGNLVFSPELAAGSWAACRVCADLVDSERWNDLTSRAVKKFAKRHGVSLLAMVGVREQFAEIHRAFAKHLLRKAIV